jgi:hypothetical protein
MGASECGKPPNALRAKGVENEEDEEEEVMQFCQFLETRMKCFMRDFEAFRAVKIQVEVFRVVTPRSVVVGYRRFRGPDSFFFFFRNLLQIFRISV